MSKKNTATSIHHYNQFLANLDKKCKEKARGKECDNKECDNKECDNKECDVKDSLQEIINNLCKIFDESHLDSPFFHGSNSLNLKEDREKDILQKRKTERERDLKERKHIDIDVEINTLDDLLKLIDTYPLDNNVQYNINMKALHNIKDLLIDLNSMIGLKSLKNSIVEQILYFIQGLHKGFGGDFMHTVLYGPPGTGKTEIAKLIGKIYSKIGILKNGVFKKVTRSDLVAGYLGQTAIKTRDVIKDCIGGVLFIDEAYALGNNEKRDSFSKECIDTLCEALSDHKQELMVIIAGYENELNDCFFNYNQGLDSRFTWRFKIDKYNGEELYQIFVKKIKENDWTVESEIEASWFEEKHDSFPFFGRDIETLLTKIKITHSKRVFCKPEKEKKRIVFKDLEKGFEIYLKNENRKCLKEKEQLNKILTSMYI
jgi:SpoVK/Ycf46/Vps4 family AAA+-type ATPase